MIQKRWPTPQTVLLPARMQTESSNLSAHRELHQEPENLRESQIGRRLGYSCTELERKPSWERTGYVKLSPTTAPWWFHIAKFSEWTRKGRLTRDCWKAGPGDHRLGSCHQDTTVNLSYTRLVSHIDAVFPLLKVYFSTSLDGYYYNGLTFTVVVQLIAQK